MRARRTDRPTRSCRSIHASPSSSACDGRLRSAPGPSLPTSATAQRREVQAVQLAAHVASSLRGRVTAAEGGAAIASAHVTVRSDDAGAAERAKRGNRRGRSVPGDRASSRSRTRRRQGRGLRRRERRHDIVVRAAAALDLVMKKAIKPGQLRGLVRSFNGKPLAATIRVEPIGVEAKTDADGTFRIDVPPAILRGRGRGDAATRDSAARCRSKRTASPSSTPT